MCGIAGIVGRDDPSAVRRMVSRLAHRGPDDSGVWLSTAGRSPVGLGSCRLAILDLTSAGHQPMTDANRDMVLTYNGEVYNYRELRSALERGGRRFTSTGDTEVVLASLAAHGIEAVRAFNGMFALGLWDARRGDLFLARDRYGIKPLYYTLTRGGGIAFASEVKALLELDEIPRDIDHEALDRYLRFLWVPGPKTMFRGIFKLQPGHYLRWHAGEVETHGYWDASYTPAQASSGELLPAELLAILRRAVERHLISDVPIGFFLSGGLDSSALLAVARDIGVHRPRAYTIAYRAEDAALEQSGHADAEHARRIAKRFDAEYTEIEVSPDVTALLPDVVYHLDEPIADPAAISTYLISREARKTVKVLLSGQGADEVFAGYRTYYVQRIATLLRPLPGGIVDGVLRQVARAAPHAPFMDESSLGRRLAVRRYLLRVADSLRLTPERRYASLYAQYTRDEQLALYSNELRSSMASLDAEAAHVAYYLSAPGADGGGDLNRMLYADLKTFLPELNLTYTDKMTSAASVEGRVPFLDNELVDFAQSLPTEYKLRGFTGKYLLRVALRDHLPTEVLKRPKAGFGAPVRRWLHHDVRELVAELLSEQSVRRRGLFDPAAVRALVTGNDSRSVDRPLRLWALLTLEVWQRTFIDGPLPAITRAAALR